MKFEGTENARTAAVLAELAGLVSSGDLEVPIAATFRLDDARAAFDQLKRGRHPSQDRPAALTAPRCSCSGGWEELPDGASIILIDTTL